MRQEGETPTIEVRIYRDGRLIRRELCESEGEAALVVEHWDEVAGTECEVDDLSARHTSDQILAAEPPEPLDEEAYAIDGVTTAEERRPS